MSEALKVPTMADYMATGESPEILFWVGCAGSFDDRAKKITKAIVKILNHANVKFAVLGTEESCTGDPAKRAGNEFLFQMQAMTNITVMNGYNVKRIVTSIWVGPVSPRGMERPARLWSSWCGSTTRPRSCSSALNLPRSTPITSASTWPPSPTPNPSESKIRCLPR